MMCNKREAIVKINISYFIPINFSSLNFTLFSTCFLWHFDTLVFTCCVYVYKIKDVAMQLELISVYHSVWKLEATYVDRKNVE